MNYENQKQYLTKQLIALESRLESIKKDLSKPHSQDFAEQATERENDEVLEEIARESASTIGHLKMALNRMEAGTYGACESCGEQIAESRLKVMPETTVCIHCSS